MTRRAPQRRQGLSSPGRTPSQREPAAAPSLTTVAGPGRRPARETSCARGYGYRWQKYSEQYRREHPLCVICQTFNRVTPAACVDHVRAVLNDDDPLFWVASNHQSLCWQCHSIKTALVDRGKGRVLR